jgi:tRNA-dihydrouridine synthase A
MGFPLLTSSLVSRSLSNKSSSSRTSLSRQLSRSAGSIEEATTTPPRIREVFSVAPMMGHTNRHYHYFCGLLSRQTVLYTEMIPAAQIVRLAQEDPLALDELLRRSRPAADNNNNNPIILQLGGRDPHLLAQATDLGARLFGYDGINLNCGCPSNAVTAGSGAGGAALMQDAAHVARIVERMSEALQHYPEVELSVKHRLGVAQAATYNAAHDHQCDDTQALATCLDFVERITRNSAVQKLQVHGRLALLGDFDASHASTTPTTASTSSSSLWVPGVAPLADEPTSTKVDHKRVRYQATKRARRATIQNRSVPPLRPRVVNALAHALPHLDFVTNGGLTSLQDVQERLQGSSGSGGEERPSNLVGCMVGRAAINHPCSFALADSLWDDDDNDSAADTKPYTTRRYVLETYAEYCGREEERVQALLHIHGPSSSLDSIERLRRRLVAVPFTLFAGEEGNHAYQRRIRKLIARSHRHTSRSILVAAMAEVPVYVLDKAVAECASTLDEIDTYSEFVQRSGPLQRAIL